MKQETFKIAYLGPEEATNGWCAAQEYFLTPYIAENFNLDFIPVDSHELIIEGVTEKKFDYGVVAVENVIDGIVVETIRNIERNSGLGINICGEVGLIVRQSLLSKTSLSTNIHTVVSHPVALSQCRTKLKEFFGDINIKTETAKSTGDAAKIASEKDGYAALAPPNAAKKYGLEMITENLSDVPNSITRFWVLHNKKEIEVPQQKTKTCILVNLDRNKSGALYGTLGFFAAEKINLTMLYPCPIPNRSWEYTFLLELNGSIYDKKFYQAYKNLRDSGLTISNPVVLGTYHDTYDDGNSTGC